MKTRTEIKKLESEPSWKEVGFDRDFDGLVVFRGSEPVRGIRVMRVRVEVAGSCRRSSKSEETGDEVVGKRWGKVGFGLWRRRRSYGVEKKRNGSPSSTHSLLRGRGSFSFFSVFRSYCFTLVFCCENPQVTYQKTCFGELSITIFNLLNILFFYIIFLFLN